MFERLLIFFRDLAGSILPMLVLLLFFQWGILRKPLVNGREIAYGLFLACLGLLFLIYGLRLGILPIAESVSAGLVRSRSVPLIVLFTLLLGFLLPLAEPALVAMAMQLDEQTSGVIGRWLFTYTVALGVALGTVVGTLRILYGIEATPFFIPMLAFILVLTYFAPERYTALAFDAALATTGPFTVTMSMGIAAAIGRSDALLYGFGIITMAALGTISSILILGITLGLLGR